MIIGLGEGETIIASDVSAIARHTKQVIYLEDGEIASVNGDGFKIFNFNNKEIDKEVHNIEWDVEKIEMSGFDHFMLKEIFEQPDTIINSTRGRLILDSG